MLEENRFGNSRYTKRAEKICYSSHHSTIKDLQKQMAQMNRKISTIENSRKTTKVKTSAKKTSSGKKKSSNKMSKKKSRKR